MNTDKIAWIKQSLEHYAQNWLPGLLCDSDCTVCMFAQYYLDQRRFNICRTTKFNRYQLYSDVLQALYNANPEDVTELFL